MDLVEALREAGGLLEGAVALDYTTLPTLTIPLTRTTLDTARARHEHVFDSTRPDGPLSPPISHTPTSAHLLPNVSSRHPLPQQRVNFLPVAFTPRTR